MDFSTKSGPDFHTFLRDWMILLECYLHQLLGLLRDESELRQDESKLQHLIDQVMTHYHEYFVAKAQVYRHDVFLVLSPPWFSSYEGTFMWLASFKPGLAINCAKSCGLDFIPDQTKRLNRLMAEIRDEERVITQRVGRLEQQVVAMPMLNQADRLAEDMEVLVECADYLREKTVAKVVEMLTTPQTVRFLAAMAQLQLRIRK